ncbi:C6 transcription factor [Metarhizium album ARSEF 1941]|uniref:C6 transcription factor n=1 Tax=Metarhizium album (strain ARSEF 1941) TaxID=1081103 RepID=A0A0B2WEQ9_METAS|nr:C6 transcription factor [Metarhizium album ARSEF 1941]KHN94336.1 C6 transcription factor [Metarhizium album ARSEF 1941]
MGNTRHSRSLQSPNESVGPIDMALLDLRALLPKMENEVGAMQSHHLDFPGGATLISRVTTAQNGLVCLSEALGLRAWMNAGQREQPEAGWSLTSRRHKKGLDRHARLRIRCRDRKFERRKGRLDSPYHDLPKRYLALPASLAISLKAKAFRGLWKLMHLHDVPPYWVDLVGMTRDSQPDAKSPHPIEILRENTEPEPSSSPEHFFVYVKMTWALVVDFRTELGGGPGGGGDVAHESRLIGRGCCVGMARGHGDSVRERRGIFMPSAWSESALVWDRPGADGVTWRKLMDDGGEVPHWKSFEHDG